MRQQKKNALQIAHATNTRVDAFASVSCAHTYLMAMAVRHDGVLRCSRAMSLFQREGVLKFGCTMIWSASIDGVVPKGDRVRQESRRSIV